MEKIYVTVFIVGISYVTMEAKTLSLFIYTTYLYDFGNKYMMENEVRERDFTYQHKLSYFTDVRKTGFLN